MRLAILLLVLALEVLSGCRKEPGAKIVTTPAAPSTPDAPASQAISQAESNFLREGGILQEKVEQGIDYETFADQLAKTNAAFDIVLVEMRNRNVSRMLGFYEALGRWNTTLDMWGAQKKGLEYVEQDDERWRLALSGMGGPKLPKGPPPNEFLYESDRGAQDASAKREGAVSVAKLVALGLRKGSEAFQAALAK